MWLVRYRIAAAAVSLLLAACTSGSEGLTVGGARTVFSDPVVVDIADARFNIPSLLPEVDRVQRTLRDNGLVLVETYLHWRRADHRCGACQRNLVQRSDPRESD